MNRLFRAAARNLAVRGRSSRGLTVIALLASFWPASVGLGEEIMRHALKPETRAGIHGQSILATAINPDPGMYPTMDFYFFHYKDDGWGRSGKPNPYIAATFPRPPGARVDMQIFEMDPSVQVFMDMTLAGNNRMIVRHRYKDFPGIIHVLTVTAESEAIDLVGHLKPDPKVNPSVEYPQDVSERLPQNAGKWGVSDICFSVRSSAMFKPREDRFYDYVERCFLFTKEGRTFLDKTQRSKLTEEYHGTRPEDLQNNPPWVQNYFPPGAEIPKQWTAFSSLETRFAAPVLGVVSHDGKYLAAVACPSTKYLQQSWAICVHTYAEWEKTGPSPLDRRWRRTFFVMENDPDALLKRVYQKYPELRP